MNESRDQLKLKLKQQLNTRKLQRNTNDTQRKVLKKKMPEEMVDSCMNYLHQKNLNLNPIMEQLNKKEEKDENKETKELDTKDQITRMMKEIQTHPNKKKQLMELMKSMIPEEQFKELAKLL